MAHQIVNHQVISKKAKSHVVTHIGGSLYEVTSGTSGDCYEVDVEAATCTCPRQAWISERNNHKNYCSHVIAATNADHEARYGESLTPRPADMTAVRRLHRKVLPSRGDNTLFTARPTVAAQKAQVGNFRLMSDAALNNALFG